MTTFCSRSMSVFRPMICCRYWMDSLTLVSRTVHGVFHRGSQVGAHLRHLLLRGPEKRVQLIIRQRQLGQQGAGVFHLRLGELIALLLLLIVRGNGLQHPLAVLLHGCGLRQDGLQVLHHLGGDALFINVGRLHAGGGGFLLPGGGDLVHHVLGRGDGIGGDVPHLQIIALGRDRQHQQQAQNRRARQKNIHALSRGGMQGAGKILPAPFFLFGIALGANHALAPLFLS